MQHRNLLKFRSCLSTFLFLSCFLSYFLPHSFSESESHSPLHFQNFSFVSSSPLNARLRFYPELLILNPYCFNTFYFRFIIFSFCCLIFFLFPSCFFLSVFLSLHVSFSHTGYPNSTRHSQFILFLFSFFLAIFLFLTHSCQKHKKRKERNCLLFFCSE